jgi:hypothetical protein
MKRIANQNSVNLKVQTFASSVAPSRFPSKSLPPRQGSQTSLRGFAPSNTPKPNMRIVQNPEFLAWAAHRGIYLDSRYDPPQTLVFPNGIMTHLAIDLPLKIHGWRATVAALFNLLPQTPLWLYKRGGTWDFLSFGDDHNGTKYTSLRHGYNAVLQTIGVPKGEFAIQFSESEHALVLSILVLQLLTAEGVRDDLFVVPESAEFCIWCDHHDMLILVCKNAEVENRLRARAEEWNIILP